MVQLNLGTGAGLANDTLDVDQAGFNYTFVSSSTLLLLFDETDPTGGVTTISFGEGSGLTGVGGPTGQLSGGLSTSPGADIAEPATNPGIAGLSVAGLGFTYTYTLVAVPKPSSAAGLMFFGLAGLVFRRRK